MALNLKQEVAILRMRYSDPSKRCVNYSIYASDQFSLGRKDFEHALGLAAPSISTHHLCFRCVSYEEDGETRVAPMIYVRVLSKNAVRLWRHDDTINHIITAAGPDVLLNDGDILHLTPNLSLEFLAADHCAAVSIGLNATQRRELEYFKHHYRITDRRLGVGGQASVFIAIKQRTQRQVACKIVRMPFLSRDAVGRSSRDLNLTNKERDARFLELKRYVLKTRNDLKREYNILKGLNHPNIVAVEKIYYSSNNTYIFQELVTGGDLLSYMEQKGVMSEPQSAVITRQILKAIEYLHDNGVAHRDIKPENILMTSWREGARLVLTDFGQSRTIEVSTAAAKSSAIFRMQTLVGTSGYAAPEVLRLMNRDPNDQGYSKAIDIWSIGCITAGLLTGDLLFPEQPESEERGDGPRPQRSLSRSKGISALDTDVRWQSVSHEAKSFVRGCVDEDECGRLTAKQALLHVWLNDPEYTAELEAVYQRAIKDWSPREIEDSIIESIDTTVQSKEPATETRSRHFPSTIAPPKNSLFHRSQTHAGLTRPAMSEENPPMIESMECSTMQTNDCITQASTIVPDFTQISRERV